MGKASLFQRYALRVLLSNCVVLRDPTAMFLFSFRLPVLLFKMSTLLEMWMRSVPMIAFEAVLGDFQELLYSLFVVSLVSPLFSLEKRLLDRIKPCKPSY